MPHVDIGPLVYGNSKNLEVILFFLIELLDTFVLNKYEDANYA